MNHLRLFLISAAVLVTAGCASSEQGWMGSPLKDTSWQLMTIESNTGDAGRDYVANKADVKMTLLANGNANFTLGCEQGSTDWRAGFERIETQGQIQFDEMLIDAPSSLCDPNSVVQRFLRDVQFMNGYVLIQNHLYLNTEANETTYGWRKIQTQ